jgi:hypothetical protein
LKGNSAKKRFISIAVAAGVVIMGTPALAQITPLEPPVLQNRIPAPLSPPPQAPTINGPLGGDPPAHVYTPPQLNTFSDRVTRCLDEGASAGMEGRRLNSYATACGNSD